NNRDYASARHRTGHISVYVSKNDHRLDDCAASRRQVYFSTNYGKKPRCSSVNDYFRYFNRRKFVWFFRDIACGTGLRLAQSYLYTYVPVVPNSFDLVRGKVNEGQNSRLTCTAAI